MPRLSILVLHRGETEPFEDSLVSVLQNRPDDCEVLVVHPESYTDPYHLDDEVVFISLPDDTSLVARANAGLLMAQGDIVHMLHSGFEATEGWTERVLPHFDRPSVGSVSPVIAHRQNSGRIAAAGVDFSAGGAKRIKLAGQRRRKQGSRRVRIAGPTFCAGFYRADALRQVGGFDPTMGETLCDVDAAMSLKAMGYACVFEPDSCIKGERSQADWMTFHGGRALERLFWRHAATSGWLRSLMAHPASVLWCVARGVRQGGVVSHVLGRMVGCLEVPIHLRHRKQLHSGRQALGREFLLPIDATESAPQRRPRARAA